jgi:carboxypeptidase C (cathepsin A)
MNLKRALFSAVAFICMASVSAATRAQAPPPDDGVARAPVAEQRKTTPFQITLGGKSIRYEATAGTLTIRGDDGAPRASMFYVAYVVPGDKRSPQRPLTFFFNGGPGSASLWLNVGGFGPMHAHAASPKPTGLAPYAFGPGEATLLDKTDMVFLDAIGTGYSRTLGDTPDNAFWGVDQDIDGFARAITRYVTINRRANAPKFLFGESYGTTRAAGLAYKLQTQGMDFNGVILMSTILNFASQLPGGDQGFINMVPTFAAAAWYHEKVKRQPAELRAFLQEARAFAQVPYATALAKGDLLSATETAEVARGLSRFVGLPESYLIQTRLRIDMEQFRKELLKDRGLMIGRFDARFTAPDTFVSTGGAVDPATNDPATRGVTSAYLSTYRDYLSGDLGYETDLSYRALFNMVISPAWDMRHKAPAIDEPLTTPNTAIDLASAMRGNSRLRVFALNGLFDLSTPFFAAELDLAHMLVGPALWGNVQFGYYESGHMIYGDQAELEKLTADLRAFYDLATSR